VKILVDFIFMGNEIRVVLAKPSDEGVTNDMFIDRFCCLSAEKLHYWTDPNVELGNFCGKCAVCGCDERYTYHVPESLWRRVLPKRLWDEIVCAKCFHEAAMIYAGSKYISIPLG